MQNTKIVDDGVMRQLCTKIKETLDQDTEEIKKFIKENADKIDLNYFSAKTSNWAPLHFAAKQNKENMLRMLVQHGANPFLSIGTIDSKTALRKTWVTVRALLSKSLYDMLNELVQIFLSQNTEYNKKTDFINLQNGMVMHKTAAEFIDDKQSFSNLYRTCKVIKSLLDAAMVDMKKLHELQKKIENNCIEIGARYKYDPYGDELVLPPATGEIANELRQENANMAISLETKNAKLSQEMMQVQNSLVSKLKL